MASKKDQENPNQQLGEQNEESRPDYLLFFAKVLAIVGLPLLIIGILFALWSFDAVIVLKVIFPAEEQFFEYLIGTWGGIVPMGMQPEFLYGNASLYHDLGIILSTLGLICLFVAATYIIRELLSRPRVPRDSKEYFIWFFKWSDTYFVLTSILLLIAWAGIWVFIHQAYIIELETWRGNLTNPQLYAFLGLSSPGLLRWGIIIIVITVCILGIFVYGYLSPKQVEVRETNPLPGAATPPNRVEWGGWFKTSYINSDWLFYFIIFIFYIFMYFGFWIFLFEGFFAKANDIPIIWALFAVIPGLEIIWPHENYYLAGIIVVIVCFGVLLILMKWISRNPKYSLDEVPDRRLVKISEFAARMKKSGYWFVGISLITILYLSISIFLFIGSFNLIPISDVLALYYHRIAQRLMFVWAIVMFYLIIIERSGERIKLENQTQEK